MYKYWGFGLHISSEIELPQLLPDETDRTDVTIRISRETIMLPKEAWPMGKYEYAIDGDKVLFNFYNVCKYCSAGDSEILVDAYPGSDTRDMQLYLLATAMAPILLKRGFIPLHASALLKDGHLLLFTGYSGAGKSTTLAHFSRRGFKVFSDDICVLEHNTATNEILAVSSYPMMKLWDNAMEKLDSDAFASKDFKVTTKLNKYGHFFHGDFTREAYPIHKIFILGLHDSDAITCTRLTGIKAFRKLEQHAYRKSLMINLGMQPQFFKMVGELISRAEVYEVKRPSTGSLAAFEETLTPYLEN